VDGSLLARSLNELGSVLSTALSEPSFGERWRFRRHRHRCVRSLLCDYGAAHWETIRVIVMLVCPSLAAPMSALTCLLTRSLGLVPRCWSSHLCSGSHTQMERVSSTELRPVPSAGLHKLSREDMSHAWRLLDCSARFHRKASGSFGSLGNEEARTAVVPKKALSMLLRAMSRMQGVDGRSVDVCRGCTLVAVLTCRGLML